MFTTFPCALLLNDWRSCCSWRVKRRWKPGGSCCFILCQSRSSPASASWSSAALSRHCSSIKKHKNKTHTEVHLSFSEHTQRFTHYTAERPWTTKEVIISYYFSHRAASWNCEINVCCFFLYKHILTDVRILCTKGNEVFNLKIQIKWQVHDLPRSINQSKKKKSFSGEEQKLTVKRIQRLSADGG